MCNKMEKNPRMDWHLVKREVEVLVVCFRAVLREHIQMHQLVWESQLTSLKQNITG